MTMKNPPRTLTRRAVRAQFRAGPRWTAPDALLTLVFLLCAALLALAPALLADLGDTVIGSRTFLPDLGATWSGVIHAVMRLLIILGVGYVLIMVREAPWSVRLFWTLAALGLMGNYARAIYSGGTATGSYILLQTALLGLLFRLSTRPTIWDQLRDERARADAAEAEVARLRGEA